MSKKFQSIVEVLRTTQRMSEVRALAINCGNTGTDTPHSGGVSVGDCKIRVVRILSRDSRTSQNNSWRELTGTTMVSPFQLSDLLVGRRA